MNQELIEEKINFLVKCANLTRLQKTKTGESIADFAWSAMILTLRLCPDDLDLEKCLKYVLIHGLNQAGNRNLFVKRYRDACPDDFLEAYKDYARIIGTNTPNRECLFVFEMFNLAEAGRKIILAENDPNQDIFLVKKELFKCAPYSISANSYKKPSVMKTLNLIELIKAKKIAFDCKKEGAEPNFGEHAFILALACWFFEGSMADIGMAAIQALGRIEPGNIEMPDDVEYRQALERQHLGIFLDKSEMPDGEKIIWDFSRYQNKNLNDFFLVRNLNEIVPVIFALGYNFLQVSSKCQDILYDKAFERTSIEFRKNYNILGTLKEKV